MNFQDTQLHEDYVLCVLNDAFNDRVGQKIRRCYEVGVRTLFVIKEITKRANKIRGAQAMGTHIPFRLPQITPGGEIPLGFDTQKRPITVPLDYLSAHLLYAGNPGSGKTNAIIMLILAMASYLKGFLIVDSYKQTLRHVAALLQQIGIFPAVLSTRHLRVNLLQADGVDPARHLAVVIDLLVRVLDITPRAISILREVCNRLYLKFGIYAGSKLYPTLFDVYEMIRSTPGLNSQARESILDKLGAFLLALTPEVGAYRSAWQPSDLQQYFMIMELAGASEQVKELCLAYILSGIMQHRFNSMQTNASLDYLIVLDDCHRFLMKHPTASGMPPFEEILGIIRSSGCTIALLVQSLEGLSRTLLANTATKIMFRMGTSADYALAADLGMNSDQLGWGKGNLRPGICITQLSQGNWRAPFVVHQPPVNMPAVFDDQAAADSRIVLNSLPVIPALEFANWQPDHTVQITTTGPVTLPPATPPAMLPPPKKYNLTAAERRLLEAIKMSPGMKVGQYSNALGMSGQTCRKACTRLILLKVVREHEVQLKTRGRKAKVLEALLEADEALAEI